MVDDIPSVAVIVQVTGGGGPRPGDADGDDDVDLDDYAAFLDCSGGPEVVPTPTLPLSVFDCLGTFDVDADADVDFADFQTFQMVFAGAP